MKGLKAIRVLIPTDKHELKPAANRSALTQPFPVESESVLFLTQKHSADRTTNGLRQRKGCEGTKVVFESSSHLKSRIN